MAKQPKLRWDDGDLLEVLRGDEWLQRYPDARLTKEQQLRYFTEQEFFKAADIRKP